MKADLPVIGFTIVVLEYLGFKFALLTAMMKGFWPPEMCKVIDLTLMFFAISATLWLASLPVKKRN
ncbi:hypothetical protein [Acaryochloris sp. CCMEE 5410]|uniref:hypothetical protein n=1 Tax=Acaryochloris sp. CCMEE 5410 TaxID=310037 RepID=UPI0002483CA3|nr:hypothetical protein [Acaryochloris sp. CCMEE 5410]KAI9132707.1 hypothetical protein ON05_004640 [Acaryochloris sp. CCMEE 5410]